MLLLEQNEGEKREGRGGTGVSPVSPGLWGIPLLC